MPAPGNAKHPEAIGELRGEIIVDVRRSARPRKKHDNWSLAAPVEHLEPNSLWSPARNRDEPYAVGRRIAPACPLGIGATPCCDHMRCDVAARKEGKQRASSGSLRHRGRRRGLMRAPARDPSEDGRQTDYDSSGTNEIHACQYVATVLTARPAPVGPWRSKRLVWWLV